MNAGFLFGTGGGLLAGCDQLLTLRVNEDRQIRAAYIVPAAVMASRIFVLAGIAVNPSSWSEVATTDGTSMPHRPAQTSRKP